MLRLSSQKWQSTIEDQILNKTVRFLPSALIPLEESWIYLFYYEFFSFCKAPSNEGRNLWIETEIKLESLKQKWGYDIKIGEWTGQYHYILIKNHHTL